MKCSNCKSEKVKACCRSCLLPICSIGCLNAHVELIGCVHHMKSAYNRAITNTQPSLPTELQEDDLLMLFKYLPPNMNLGEEIHSDTTQFFMILSGTGRAIINGKSEPIAKNSMFFVPKNTLHDVYASEDEPLRFLTIYGKKEHSTSF